MSDQDHELLRAGMCRLIGTFEGRFEEDYITVLRSAAPLDAHPFGFNIEDGLLPGMRHGSEPLMITLIGSPDSTQDSVESMTVIARFLAATHYVSAPTFRYLRMNYCAIGNGKNDVFFEIGSSHGVFICAGCNDYSGAGSAGKDKLFELFSFLSAIYQKDIVQMDIPHPRSARMTTGLFRLYSEHVSSRRSARLR